MEDKPINLIGCDTIVNSPILKLLWSGHFAENQNCKLLFYSSTLYMYFCKCKYNLFPIKYELHHTQ